MQADPQLQIMDEARREKAMQLRYDERQETRSLERKNFRQVERLMWYTTDLSHLHQVFLDFTLERQTSRPFFWHVSHGGGTNFLNAMERCFDMPFKKEFNRQFYHAIQHSASRKWVLNPNERIDFYQAEVLHDAVNTLWRAGRIRTRLVVAFRNPMDRLLSFFTNLNKAGTRFQEMSFFEYLDGPTVLSQDNLMVRQIVDKPWPTPLTHYDLEAAIELIERKAFLLDAEDRATSMLHLHAFLGIEGESEHRDACVSQIVQSGFGEDVDASLHTLSLVQEKINEHVRFDFALYRRMKELFLRQGEMLGISRNETEQLE